MNKAVFLDRDGTINVEKNYLYRIEDFEFIPGVIEGLRRLQEAGFLLFILTNQSGIARGYYQESEFLRLNEWMLSTLHGQGVDITRVYYCPHLPDAVVPQYRKRCRCRKPGLGMFRKAVREYDLDLSQSFAIGDKLRDLSICNHSACRGFLVGNTESPEIIADAQKGKLPGVRYADFFTDAVDKLLFCG